MNKDFTLYPEAFELKELGFDEPCFAWYVSESYGLEYGEVIKFDLIRDGIVAPTYSQAFRWFREQQNLYGVYMMGDDWNNFYFHIWRNDTMTKKFVTSSNWVYETYEEAELACLKKLIEIVKGGNK